MKIQIVITVDCTEERYEGDFKKTEADIKSGEFQRNLINREKGITKATTTFKILKR